MTDVHAHLDDPQFDPDRSDVIRAIGEAGYTVITSGCCHRSSAHCLVLAENYPFLYASVGVFPHDTTELEERGVEELRAMARHPRAVAIGEIGLDYHWQGVERSIQKKWFHKQLELAEEVGLPVVIHCRDAIRDTLDILKEHPANTGIFHCYSGSTESLREVLALGWSISLGGVTTFQNARVSKEVAKAVPADRLMLETDCPFLAPVPHRGTRNSPLYLPAIRDQIAALRGVSPDFLEKETDENAKRIFHLQ